MCDKYDGVSLCELLGYALMHSLFCVFGEDVEYI
jgi:hypothetical protein